MARWTEPFVGGPVPAGPCRNCGEPLVAVGAVLTTRKGTAEDLRWTHAVGGNRCRITFAQPKYWQEAVVYAWAGLTGRDVPQDAAPRRRSVHSTVHTRGVAMIDEDTSVLTPQHVHAVFEDCLFRDGEDTSAAVLAEGIMSTAGFHPARLAGHKDEIRAMLAELPDDFHMSGGGGMSFLNACTRRDGELWTGEHRTMELLFQLGMATGLVTCLLPREVWPALPGGMPYYAVVSTPEETP